MFDQLIKFCQESYQELRLSSWLTTEQMAKSTLIVIILTVILAVFVSGIDQVLLFFAKILFRIG